VKLIPLMLEKKIADRIKRETSSLSFYRDLYAWNGKKNPCFWAVVDFFFLSTFRNRSQTYAIQAEHVTGRM
jgi:hypothetical protein